jgi:hypothetical protein
MTVRTLLAAFVLMAAPGFAYANCSSGHAREAMISCADGTTWDAASQSCVTLASS